MYFRPHARPSDPDTMTNTALEAIASSSGKKHSNEDENAQNKQIKVEQSKCLIKVRLEHVMCERRKTLRLDSLSRD